MKLYVFGLWEFFEQVRNSKVINSRNFHNNVQKKDKQQTWNNFIR